MDGRSKRPVPIFVRKGGCTANRYNDWSSQELERMLMLDRKQGFGDEELTEGFDRRCAEALDEVFEDICGRYPNAVYPRKRRKGKPPGRAGG